MLKQGASSNNFGLPTSDRAPFQVKRLETTFNTCAQKQRVPSKLCTGQSPLSLTAGRIQPEPHDPVHAAIPHTEIQQTGGSEGLQPPVRL